MKKQIKKSPFKLTEEEKKKKQLSSSSSSINTTKEGVAYKVKSSMTKSESAGGKLANTTTTVVPAKKSTSNVEALKKGAKNLGPGYKPSAAETARANKRLREAKAKDAAASTPEQTIIAPSQEGASSAGSESSQTNTIGERSQTGATALDIRGALRAAKVTARVAGQSERKANRQENRADKLESKGKTGRAEALRTKAAMNKGVSENAKQYGAKLKEQAQQGSTGNLSYKTSEAVTLAEQDANKKGMNIGETTVKSSSEVSSKPTQLNSGFKTPEKPEEKIGYKFGSALKMLKPGSFKMMGFGNKSKK